MDLALKTAENAGKSGEVPIGCVIVRGYEIIATASNRTLTDRDPTAHAEILAIRQAADTIGTERLVDCDLYVTLEPCTMCAGLLVHSRVGRLVYGAQEPKSGAILSRSQVLEQPWMNHRMLVEGGVLAQECGELLSGFFRERRKKADSV